MTATGPAPVPAPPEPHRSPVARALLVTGAAVAVLAVLWGAVFLVDRAMASTTTQHETYGSVPTVELVADGDVTVKATDGGQVEVDRIARHGLTSPTYRADEGADRLVVTHECQRWQWIASRCAGDLAVTLPADTALVVRTSNGDVVASGVVGGAELRSSNGDVQVAGAGGGLDAGSSNGDVVVDEAVGDVVATSSNGSIEVTGVDGSLEADTSNGRVEVAGVTGDVRAESSNGDVTVVGDGEPVRLTIETSNGGQTTEGPTDPGADRSVEVRSSNGDVAYLLP
ncbi:DUF4097 family beta strand repeat-containing protein [Krasilnikoviella flava]|uniref:Putative adhesin n=1 Tax=Krasilnikoviella flava TaxID=526729 RepID=A0A1T5IRD2_9MICO|nr:DUF4097 family beta strand repeat-containing protein [Krasilnikoviella flava]SKC41675.1 Putative adhesin [Krasilnikoviella flava]